MSNIKEGLREYFDTHDEYSYRDYYMWVVTTKYNYAYREDWYEMLAKYPLV